LSVSYGNSARNWMAFAILAPGVNGDDQNASINGLPQSMYKILVEGQDVTSTNDTVWTSVVAASSVEAIGEFSLQTSNFSAQYAGGVGAQFNFTTKSGTNRLHGSLYDYMTNETMFNAHRFFQASRRDKDRKHDGGGTIGGPVYIPKIYNGRDKTFFFFNLEVYRNTPISIDQSTTVPTLAMRDGDFSAALTGTQLKTGTAGVPYFDGLGRAVLQNVIYDPGTERTVNGVLYRDPYQGNIIPKPQLDPVALKIQNLIPKPTGPRSAELINNYLYDLPGARRQNLPSIKVDHNFSTAMKLVFMWSHQSTFDTPGNDYLPDPITGKRAKTAVNNNFQANYDLTLRPTLLLHVGVGFMRFNNPDSASRAVLDYDAAKELGIFGSTTDPSGFPRITGLNVGNYGGMSNSMGPSNANDYWNDKATLNLDATYIRGDHTYKAGGMFNNEMWSDRNTRGSQGIYNFSNAQTGLPSLQGVSFTTGDVGFNYASFLSGRVASASVNAVQDPQWRKNAWALYVQDNWKVGRKLTLDMGMRWDLQGLGHEIFYRNSMFGPTVPNPTAGNRQGAVLFEGYGTGRCNCQFTDTYPYAISPRIGAAYQIDPKTVFRAGWALSYGAGPNWWYVTNQTLLGVGFDSYTTPSVAFDQTALLLKNGLAPMYNKAALYTPTLNPGLGITAGSVAGSIGNFYDRNGGRPQRINQWNIALQRELVRNVSLEVAYVANRGAWLEADNLGSLNVMSTQYLLSKGLDVNNAADRALLTSNLSSSAVIARGFTVPYAGYPTNRTLAQSLRPFPQITGSITPRWAPLGNSWYDSLQAKLTKRFSHGLDMQASFTWSKELSLGSGAQAGGALGGGINDMFNRANQKSLSTGSRPLMLVASFGYQTPRLTTNRLVRAATGDWIFNGILTYRSGRLISVPGSNSSNIGSYTFMSNTRMNRVNGQWTFTKDPSCHCIDPNKDTALLNPAMWQDVSQGQWGFSAPSYNDYRWVRSANEQLSVGRTFFLDQERRVKLSIRVEMFNAFNRLTLPAPSSGNPFVATTYDSLGRVTSGFGFINTINGIDGARNGQGVIRFEF